MEMSIKENDRDHEAECGLRTLLEAQEIKANKELMARIKKIAGPKMDAMGEVQKEISSMADLKEAKAKFNEKKLAEKEAPEVEEEE